MQINDLGANYWVYTCGTSVSLTGNWLQRMTVMWLAWQWFHSPTLIGCISAAELLPIMALSPIAGMHVDRFGELPLIWTSQVLGAVQAILLMVIVQYASGNSLVLLLATIALGCANAYYLPARLSLLPRLVRNDKIPVAVSINSVVGNGALMVGPALAGAIITYWGPQAGLLANFASYLPLFAALAVIRPKARDALRKREEFFAAIRSGILYAWRHEVLRPALVLFTLASLAGRSVVELLSGIAGGLYGDAAWILSALTSIFALGALAGSLLTFAVRSDNTVAMLALFMVPLAACTAGLGWCPNLWWAEICTGTLGISSAVICVLAQTAVQERSEASVRGRVNSLYGVLFRGSPALGALGAGVIADRLGWRYLLTLLGVAMLLGTVYVSRWAGLEWNGIASRYKPRKM
jgi:MFS family permease